MGVERDSLLEWAAQGCVQPRELREAARVLGVTPDAAQWRDFADRALLFAGVVLLGAGVIFFLAFNWQALDRYAKFGLAQACIVAALLTAWRLDLDRVAGQAALLAASLFTGALLALVGQTYQTGADTFELFTAWALAILPWVLVARFAALWLLWLGIVNLALMLYCRTHFFWFDIVFAPYSWMLLALNGAALIVWEALASRRGVRERERWALRVLATVVALAAMQLMMSWVFDDEPGGAGRMLAWLLVQAALLAAYRRRIKDVYMLACGALSGIAVAASLLSEWLLRSHGGYDEPVFSFLLIGVAVIGLSALAGRWLRQVAAEPAA